MRPTPSGTTSQLASRPLLVGAFVFLMAAAAAATLIWNMEQHRLQEERARAFNLAGDHAYDLQRRLDRAFSATYALAVLVRQGNGAIADFDDVARQMLPFYPEVSALQLVPGGVIRQIVPLAGNEGAIGHNLLKDKARNKEAILARDTGELTLAGPFDLVQGGVGAVARLPVFFGDKKGKSSFWGFTAVLIRFPEMLDRTLLTQLAGRGFGYELWRIHPDTGKKQVIAASAAIPLAAPVEHVIQVPNGTWTLSMAPVKGWGDAVGLALKIALGLLFSLLLAYLAKLLVELKAHKAGLETLVSERTSEIRKSEGLYRSLFENMLNGFAYCRMVFEDGTPRDFIYLAVNEAFESQTGLKDVVGRKVTEVIPGIREADPHLFEIYGRVAMTGQPETFEMFIEALQNWYSISVYSPEHEYFVVLFDVVTERKRAERSLAEKEAQQRILIETIPDLIWLKDANGIYLSCNKMFEQFFGFKEADIVGKADYDFVDKDLADFFRDHDRKAIEAGKPTSNLEWITFASDGHRALLNTIKTPMCDVDGKLLGVLGIGRDITEYHKLEEQLLHSQKMESIGTLAGGIAHDFNNILTAIIGYGNITLMKIPVDDQLRHNIESMLEAADRAARLTKELLLFSRKQPIDKKPVDLNEVVSRVEKFLKKVIGEDITFRSTLYEARLPVFADAYQLEQVLMNLATNARDSILQGGSLTVTTARIVLDGEFVAAHGYGKPGPYALITVSDTGMGMDEETQKRIFEPFFTTKEVGKGTGLGLSVAYGIIKQHDGYINVYSEPCTGTAFRIYLPLNVAETGQENPSQQDEPVIGGTETILLAEDDEQVRILTASILENAGYTVIAAVDGADAVSKFVISGERIDLLLFDLIMPRMNGKEAFDEIRELQPEMKGIFVSGYAPEDITHKVSMAVGAHMITKPILPTELLWKVRSVLDE